MADPNLELLARVAAALGDLCERLTLVGGCATGLLITDPAAAPVRATQDVDAIVAVVSLAEYQRMGGALRERGFRQTLEGGEPPYRWTYAGLKLDLMPTDPGILGFSNRWYGAAMKSAFVVDLGQGVAIRVADAPSFVATKLEAFLDRGGGDYLSSSDLEDVLSVIDGRPELAAELGKAPPELRAFVAQTFARLLADEALATRCPAWSPMAAPRCARQSCCSGCRPSPIPGPEMSKVAWSGEVPGVQPRIDLGARSTSATTRTSGTCFSCAARRRARHANSRCASGRARRRSTRFTRATACRAPRTRPRTPRGRRRISTGLAPLRETGVQAGGPAPLDNTDRKRFADQLDRFLAKTKPGSPIKALGDDGT